MAKQQKAKKRGAQITSLPLRAANGTPLIAFPTQSAQHFRRMLTGLMHRDELPRRLSVMATLRQEGVTYTTLALATTLASDMAVSVCAVELNWQSPGMQTQLSVGTKKKPAKRSRQGNATDAAAPPPSPGLAAVLNDTATFDDVLIQTDLPNLALLPAGDLPVLQHSYMARSERLRSRIEELSLRFDYLLLDIPAIQATSDAISLASLGTAGCLVVRQGITPISKVRESLDEVKHLSILGVVLNKIQVHTPQWLLNFVPQD
jgi:Mrp family chromosome partitioning ATPase